MKKEMYEFYIKGRTAKIPKDSIIFEHGLAVVSIKVTNSYYQEYNMKGVIDKNFEFVLSPEGYYEHIEIFPDNNIIAGVRCGDENHTRIEERLYKKTSVDSIKFKKIKRLNSYTRINESVIKMKDYDDKMNEAYVLYDVVQGKTLSKRFDTIGDFEKQQNGEELAIAKNKIYHNDGTNNFSQLICYIDKDGVIRTPLLNTYDNSIFVCNTELDYENTLEIIKTKIQQALALKEKNKQKVLETFWKIKL